MLRSTALIAAVAAVPLLPAVAAGRPASDLHLVHGRATAKTPAPPGVIFGGRTKQDWPVVIEVSHDLRQVVRTDVGLRLRCTSGGFTNQSDSYLKMPLSTRGSFSSSFGGQNADFGNGHKAVYSGAIKGKLNARLTSGTGTWSLKLVESDATGAVVDTCDSGVVTWKVKQ